MPDEAATIDPLRRIERPAAPRERDEPKLPPSACWDRSPLPDGASFALCLTHDVDRPYKGLRSLFYAAQERPAYHLRTALSDENPYWQFEEIRDLEDDLDVRSAFYVLNEQHLLAERPVRDWLSPTNWVQHLGRYDVRSPDVRDAIADLAAGGWEVGLHGSFHSADDRDRLAEEKAALEDVLAEASGGKRPNPGNRPGGEERPTTGNRSNGEERPNDEGAAPTSVSGGRQHYLRCTIPETWRHHRAIGLDYDASLGSGTHVGFHSGYRPIRPFGDDFRVFPLTAMEQALPDPSVEPEAARLTCEELLLEAAANEAVMTVLWHPRYFNEREFPGYRGLYRWLVERAQELGAWIGPPRALLEALDETDGPHAPIEAGSTGPTDTSRRR
ncbi:polysaccharide deacetylase family protein [Halovivax cerinus]|uniref:Polysaccharide deacetylase family protein n=1 Tax=Halovivax cerinus TaxID=1487865 RepID=A0ABD5NUI4_9EURY|nr:polysaccharide deacetylase family protein [Halovivax cerinus]